jgi:hypothetical protein
VSDRALIIAIWKYAGVQGLAPVNLDSVQPGAEKFYTWLTQTRNVPPENILVCSDGLTLHGHPASAMIDGTSIPLVYKSTFAEIAQAVGNLVSFAPDRTGDFFIYYAGHGFSYRGNPNDQGVSFLLTSEFVSPGISGNACINIPLMQRNLSSTLSGKHHFHFVDACRNELAPSSINPQGNFGVVFQPSNNGSAPLFNLYSARQGDAADASPAFTDALVEGLRGDGHAKQWVNSELWVTFNRVTLYTAAALSRKLASEAGDQDDRIEIVPKPWTQSCNIVVKNNPSTDPYKLTISQGGALSTDFAFATVPFTVPLPPNDNPYLLTLTQAGRPLLMLEPTDKIDMYGPCNVVFVPASPPTATPPPKPQPPVPLPTMATLRINPDFLNVSGLVPARNFSIDGGKAHPAGIAVEGINLSPGLHRVSLIEDGYPVWHEPIDLAPGAHIELSVGSPAPTKFQSELLQTIGQENYLTPELSETLGPTADWDVNLWLAYLGVAHLRKWQGVYLKLQTVLGNLNQPPGLDPGEAGLLVLVMDDTGAPNFGLHQDASIPWSSLQVVPGLQSLYSYSTVCSPGSAFFSLQRKQGEPFTYSTTFTDGKYTLITIATGADVRVQQISLPQTSVASNDGWAHPVLTDLQTARLLSYAQSELLARRPVWRAAFAKRDVWTDLLQGNWRNEQLATLCAFDCKRRGIEGDLREFLTTYYTGTAIGFASDLAALQVGTALSTPFLLMDAYLLAGDAEKQEPFSAGRIDFRGLWVSWYGAVPKVRAVRRSETAML